METNNVMDLVSNLSGAIATLLAVVLAFLLSILTDRNSWKQRKKEQIRDHQLESIKLLVNLMQTVDFTFHYIIQKLNNTLNETGQTGNATLVKNKIETVKYELQDKILELKKIKVNILNEYWELKLLKFDTDGLNIIDLYINEFDKTLKLVNEQINIMDGNAINNNNIEKIDSLFRKFIKEAVNGLTQ